MTNIDILEYFRTQKLDHRMMGIGLSMYAPLILIINDREKIVPELLEDSDCYYKTNLLSYLDTALYDCMRAKDYSEELYEDIRWVLNAYIKIKNSTENYTGTDLKAFEEYLKENE